MTGKNVMKLAGLALLAAAISGSVWAGGAKYAVLHDGQYMCVTNVDRHLAHGDPLLGTCTTGAPK